ncbi:MAG: hypothetical protein L0Y80_05480 [Ignavibacteriae bacterium]|nr:hypothetical protein [Ignavibacteriota bacterium]
MTPKYRILITKTLEVPKNVLTALYDSEQEAVKAAEAKLAELDGDVAIVMEVLAGASKVIQTFEKVRKAG